MPAVAGLFENHQDVDRALDELHARGFGRDAISVVAREGTVRTERTAGDVKGASIGASTTAGIGGGAALGGLVGLLVGLGALAIPGVGPVIAAGSLAGALGSTAVGAGIGATAGGLVGALDDAGFRREESHFLAEGVKRGGILVTVSGDGAALQEAEAILRRAGALDMQTTRAAWQQQGWSEYDAASEPGSDYPTLSSRSRDVGPR